MKGSITIPVRITFTDPVLGTSPNSDDIYREFIASKAPDAVDIEGEVAAIGVDAVAEKGTTVFPRDAGGAPVLFDYQIKGFFKDSCSALSRLGKSGIASESSKIKAFKKIIDGLVFIEQRMIPIHYDGNIRICQRPLRAQTAQGERVSLAASEEIPAGAHIDFDILLLDPKLEDAVVEWLDYGVLRGIGQWRNSGKGRFKWERR